jgi:hypothetical protein
MFREGKMTTNHANKAGRTTIFLIIPERLTYFSSLDFIAIFFVIYGKTE